MENSFKRAVKTLELDKILERLAGLTACRDAYDMALSIVPETRLNEANFLLEQTKDAYALTARFAAPSFSGLKNVDNALARAAAGSSLSTRELLDIVESLRVIRSLSEWRKRNSGGGANLDPLFSALVPNKYLEESITTAIISEDEISDNASPTLADIRRKIRRKTSGIKEQLESFIRSPHYRKLLQEPIVTQRNDRYVIPVKAEHRSEVAGLVHDTSSSGATVFIEPASVVEANNEIRMLLSEERDEIERIIAFLSSEAGSFEAPIKESVRIAAELNLIFAKASLAYAMKASAPVLNNKGLIELKKARHPLIPADKVVPIDIRLGFDYDALIITGPNTGGKTVSIKTLGLLTLMAMCGLMIPAAENSQVCVFKGVFADIGDEQSIEQSLSTFSSHMTNIVRIIEECEGGSLVLIDELGAGTDPIEGAALAISILEHIRQKGAKIAATTHYAELKAYALQTQQVENASCEFDVSTLKPTYRLLTGVPGRSNAFAISERLGLPSEITDRAKEIVSTENVKFESLVTSLEEKRSEAEQKLEEAKEKELEAQRLLEEAKEKLEKARLQSEKEAEKARSEALRFAERAKREANTFMLELDKIKQESEKIKEKGGAQELRRRLRQGINALEDSLNPVSVNMPASAVIDDEPPKTLKAGDNVLLIDMGCEAEVVSFNEKADTAEVQIGGIKMRVEREKLRLTGRKKKAKGNSSDTISTVKNVKAERKVLASEDTRCDIRGLNVEEALPIVDIAIDNLAIAGLNEITIIHGKGTGKLRAAVHSHLRKHPQIKSFRLGTFGEGETGVTIAQLK